MIDSHYVLNSDRLPWCVEDVKRSVHEVRELANSSKDRSDITSLNGMFIQQCSIVKIRSPDLLILPIRYRKRDIEGASLRQMGKAAGIE